MLFLTLVGAQAQSNLLNNFSFENFGGFPIPEWGNSECCLQGHINEPGAAADGGNYVSIMAGGSIWQDVQTVPGRSYIVGFAVSVFNSKIRILSGGAVIGEVNFTNVPGQGQWFYTNFTSAAVTSTITRFEFQGVMGSSDIDAVRVGWREEPPSITTQVPSRSSFDGGTVTFPVVPSGGPPLAYQWYFNDVEMITATNRVLTITNVQKQDEGSYTVRITNSFGQTASLPATLITQPIPHLPLIVAQPKSQQTTAGYFAGFYVFAVGSLPLRYQWRFGVTNDIIPGATNAHFSIPSVAQSDAGDYSVLVSNDSGESLSIPATLSVATGFGGGVVVPDNLNSPVDAPVFDVDGTTRLSGADYWAQIYSGATSNSLHAVGSPLAFWTDDLAGYYFGNGAISIPDVPAGQVAYVQVRAWDHRFGETFEEARALGGKFGKSGILSILLSGPPPAPTPLTGLLSFSLQAGQPLLATAKLYPGKKTPEGDQQWLLVGDVGARYIVEHRAPPNDWSPLLVATNSTGTVSFVDTNAQNSSVNFYRARILEE